MSQKLKRAMSRNKTIRNLIQRGGAVKFAVVESEWYDTKVDADKLPLPELNEDNMEETYKNRRDHLTNWMITILTTKKSDFRICNQKQISEKGDLPMKDEVYLSPINAGIIKNLKFVDYYAFDYYNEKSQKSENFLNPKKFDFEDENKEFVDISQINFYQMNASGNDNSCGFFALLQAISPLYRALNYPAKIHITRKFRNSYVPQIIVNKNGAPMSTKEYKTTVMGGDAQTNELDTIRAKYNDIDSETPGTKYKLIEYLNKSQKTQFTGVSMHIRNSWFFGYNMVSISKKTQPNVVGKYKFFKDEIEGPEKVTNTILICNMSSAHYMTIGVKNGTGKMEFIFDETDKETREMIDAISVKGTAADVVTNLETGLTFNGIKFEEIFRKIISDPNEGGNTFYIVFNKPIGESDFFSTELDKTLQGMKVYNDYIIKNNNFKVDPKEILCYAINMNTQEYYYVLSYEISYVNNAAGLETWKVAKITKNDKDLTVEKYLECGTISYDNTKGNVTVDLSECANVTEKSKKEITSQGGLGNFIGELVEQTKIEADQKAPAEQELIKQQQVAAAEEKAKAEAAENVEQERIKQVAKTAETAEKAAVEEAKAAEQKTRIEALEQERLKIEAGQQAGAEQIKNATFFSQTEEEKIESILRIQETRLQTISETLQKMKEEEEEILHIMKEEKKEDLYRMTQRQLQTLKEYIAKIDAETQAQQKALKDQIAAENAKENTCFVRIKFIKNDATNEFDVGEIDTVLFDCGLINTKIFPNKISEIDVNSFYLFKFELNTNELGASNISPSNETSDLNTCKDAPKLKHKIESISNNIQRTRQLHQ